MRHSLEAARILFKDNYVTGVEVGVCRGGNAIEMLDQWKKLKSLHLVDPYFNNPLRPPKTTLDNLDKFNNRIIWHVKDSVTASLTFKDESVDFVYIDGSHWYKYIRTDIKVWFPKVKKGGVLCGHDYDEHVVPKEKKEYSSDYSRGVIRAVDEFIIKTGYKLHTKKHENTYPTLYSRNTTDWWIYK